MTEVKRKYTLSLKAVEQRKAASKKKRKISDAHRARLIANGMARKKEERVPIEVYRSAWQEFKARHTGEVLIEAASRVLREN